ncbi:MAG TPA: hypothetical protein VG757_03665 [Devosia sp.]|nr:hypothetical protein [Devosia sp.]
MDFDDLIAKLTAPPNRVGKHEGDHEHHLYEGAVMVAYAMHLFQALPTHEVRIYPDGMHGAQFDFTGWLGRRGFGKVSALGSTLWGGIYSDKAGHTIIINPKSGQGDIVAESAGVRVVAECKGGVTNTSHAGQISRLERGLSEAVGQLMSKENGGRQIAVVPMTRRTSALARRMARRCAAAGIEIALVSERGEVTYVVGD